MKWFLAFFFMLTLLLVNSGCRHDTVFVPCSDPLLVRDHSLLLYKKTPFTGRLYGMFDETDTLFVENYKSGVLDGELIKYYKGGTVREKLSYINGRQKGVQAGYWDNGNDKFKTFCKGGKTHGVSEGWYRNGVKKWQYEYLAGNQEGVQTEWGKDGRLHRSYIVNHRKITELVVTQSCTYK